MELRELDWVLGELAVPPDPDEWEVFHTSTRCPSVTPDYRVHLPRDPYYEQVKDLGWCAWCRKYRHNLVEPVELG